MHLSRPLRDDVPFLNWMLNEDAGHGPAVPPQSPSVVFRPGPLSFVGEGTEENAEFHQTVLTGPRQHLNKGRRHRLKRCLGKALFGKRFNQQLDQTPSEEWKLAMRPGGSGGHLPIGMRMQYFAFVRHAKYLTSSFMKW